MNAADAMLRTLATALPGGVLPTDVPHLGAAEARSCGRGSGAGRRDPPERGRSSVERGAARDRVGIERSGRRAQLGHDARAKPGGARATELAAAAQSGSWESIGTLAARSGLDPMRSSPSSTIATRPALRAGARAVHEIVVKSRWQRGTCPACGAAPLLGELRGGGASGTAEHERVLRCGRCLSAWSFPATALRLVRRDESPTAGLPPWSGRRELPPRRSVFDLSRLSQKHRRARAARPVPVALRRLCHCRARCRGAGAWLSPNVSRTALTPVTLGTAP